MGLTLGWAATWWAFGGGLALALFAGLMHRRRGIGRWSLPPWDFILLAAAIAALAAAGHLLELWRDA